MRHTPSIYMILFFKKKKKILQPVPKCLTTLLSNFDGVQSDRIEWADFRNSLMEITQVDEIKN